MSYIETELYNAVPLPATEVGTIRLQIRTVHGATKWINITPAEFKGIEDVLLKRLDTRASDLAWQLDYEHQGGA